MKNRDSERYPETLPESNRPKIFFGTTEQRIEHCNLSSPRDKLSREESKLFALK